jgi:hypothetical protein
VVPENHSKINKSFDHKKIFEISQKAQNKFFSKFGFKCFGFLLAFFDLILKKLRILEGFKKKMKIESGMKKANFNICQDSNPHQAIFSKSIRFK